MRCIFACLLEIRAACLLSLIREQPLPCHRMSDQEALDFVKDGSLLWVYPAAVRVCSRVCAYVCVCVYVYVAFSRTVLCFGRSGAFFESYVGVCAWLSHVYGDKSFLDVDTHAHICTRLCARGHMTDTLTKTYSHPCTNQGKRGRPFEAFVQLLHTGQLFIQGVQQNVRIRGAMQGCSEHVKTTYKLTDAQRKGAFRVRAVPTEDFPPCVPRL
jgi:hypothetical protein